MPVVDITSIDDPQIAVYRGLKTDVAKRHRRWFIVEGLSLTERLLASSLPVFSVLTEPAFVDRLLPHVPGDAPLYVAAHALIEALAGYHFHRGVLACAGRPPNPELGPLLAAASLPAVLPVCVGVQDPENLGVIIRSSAAFAAPGVLLGPACPDPFSRRVARTSMGTLFHLPIRRAVDLKAELQTLRETAGVQVVATVLDADAEPLNAVPPAPRTALLLGSEGHGLDRQWIEQCDRRVTIPMAPGVDSLNVGVAAGIFLYYFNDR